MNIITAAIITVLIIFVLNFVFERYYKQKQLEQEDLRARLEVLKVVAKHECFGKYHAEPAGFQVWVAKFLELKGYSEVKFGTEKLGKEKLGTESGEQGLTAINLNGKNVYIHCKLVNPADWDKDVSKTDIKNMVGAMIEKDIHQGLIVTTGKLSPEAEDYLAMIEERDYFISYIDGAFLEEELYVLRSENLPELQEAW